MGGEIDAIGAVSEPQHYAGREDPEAQALASTPAVVG